MASGMIVILWDDHNYSNYYEGEVGHHGKNEVGVAKGTESSWPMAKHIFSFLP